MTGTSSFYCTILHTDEVLFIMKHMYHCKLDSKDQNPRQMLHNIGLGCHFNGHFVDCFIYADDITSVAKKYIQEYIHKVFAWTKRNNLILNPDKTCALFTPDPVEYTSIWTYKYTTMYYPWQRTQPKVLGLTLDTKLAYNTHIHNSSVHAHKPPQIIKALTATGWGKQKETLSCYETGSGVCLFCMVAYCIFDQQ